MRSLLCIHNPSSNSSAMERGENGFLVDNQDFPAFVRQSDRSIMMLSLEALARDRTHGSNNGQYILKIILQNEGNRMQSIPNGYFEGRSSNAER